MSNTIQVNAGDVGTLFVEGLDATADTTLDDVSGASARVWHVDAFPSRMSNSPSITNPTHATATIPGGTFLPGDTCMVKLGAVAGQPDCWVALKFDDADGLAFPCPGFNVNGQDPRALADGYAGQGSTNTLANAYITTAGERAAGRAGQLVGPWAWIESEIDSNTVVPGRLDALAWRVSAPELAPMVRKLVADSAATGTRGLIGVNLDSLAPSGGYLERPFTVPTGVSAIRLELDEVQLPNGVGSSPAFTLELWDATGITQVSTTSFTPTGTPTNEATANISVTAGVEYRVRVCVTGAGQATFVCGAFRVRPTTSSDSFWTTDFKRLDVNDAVLADSNEVGYANPRFALQSAYSHVDLLTNAVELRVEAYDNAGDYVLGINDHLSVYVDGYPLDPPLVPTIGATSYLACALPVGAKAVRLAGGLQVLTGLPSPATENRGTFLCAAYVAASAGLRPIPPAPPQSGETIVLYGDSKLAGSYSSLPGRDSLAFLLRKRGHRVICETAGGRSLAGDVGTTLTVAACKAFARKLVRHRPTQVIVGIGRNDFVGATYSPADLVTQIGNLIDAINAVAPAVKVKLLTWTHETTETAVSATAWDTERDNIAALATSRSTFCSVLDSGAMWSTAEATTYTSDTVHPNDRGYERIDRLIAGEAHPWTPLQLTQTPTIWCEGDASGLAGAAMGSVTSAGTSPPTVTFTGTPAAAFRLRLEVTTAGARGSALFRWSIDGGRSWVARNVATAATVVLGSTGITANFATGSYSNDNTYTASTKLGGWKDLSGSGNDLVQASSANQPLFELAGINSRATASIVAGPTYLAKSGISISAPYSVACVASLTDQNTLRAALGPGTGTGTAAPTLYANSATTMALLAGGQQQGVTVDATAAHVYVGVVVGGGSAGSALWVDGTKTPFAAAPADNTITNIAIGADIKNSIFWDKWISAFLLAPYALSDSEVRSLTARWRAKYGTP